MSTDGPGQAPCELDGVRLQAPLEKPGRRPSAPPRAEGTAVRNTLICLPTEIDSQSKHASGSPRAARPQAPASSIDGALLDSLLQFFQQRVDTCCHAAQPENTWSSPAQPGFPCSSLLSALREVGGKRQRGICRPHAGAAVLHPS